MLIVVAIIWLVCMIAIVPFARSIPERWVKIAAAVFIVLPVTAVLVGSLVSSAFHFN